MALGFSDEVVKFVGKAEKIAAKYGACFDQELGEVAMETLYRRYQGVGGDPANWQTAVLPEFFPCVKTRPV